MQAKLHLDSSGLSPLDEALAAGPELNESLAISFLPTKIDGSSKCWQFCYEC